MSNIGPILREARIAAGMTQKALADALGIVPQYLVQIENGKRPLAYRMIAKLPNEVRGSAVSAAIEERRQTIGELRRQITELQALK